MKRRRIPRPWHNRPDPDPRRGILLSLPPYPHGEPAEMDRLREAVATLTPARHFPDLSPYQQLRDAGFSHLNAVCGAQWWEARHG